MIILDNSVLSAFTRLALFNKLQELFAKVYISEDIYEEYSKKWKKQIPSWISIRKIEKKIDFEKVPLSLSPADLSVIKLVLSLKVPIASDDRELRSFAKHLGITITGSLGIIKMLFKQRIIKSKEEYLDILQALSQDIFLTNELYKWALEE
ncbi:MAG: hypothetical protein GF308_08430 [Candidatus Heimdallarchaeota archaeon]|nr:hypothetical protein [Candidatus Heimdallarchaeota archaeon]